MSGHVSPLCRCGQPLNKHAVNGQYDGGCFESGCDEFQRAPKVEPFGMAEELPASTVRIEAGDAVATAVST